MRDTLVLLTFNMGPRLTELVRYDDGSYGLMQDGAPMSQYRWAPDDLEGAINVIIQCIRTHSEAPEQSDKPS